VEKVKETKEYKVWKKGSGRYAVTDAKNNWVNAEKKVEILLKEGLIKAPLKKKEQPAEAAAPAAE